MNIGKIQLTEITGEMQRSYLDYAMSVIVARALPDVRDGLKPVQRRIIYAMHSIGVTAHSRHTKCAKVVGEVLGKYHPHGDAPVYEALVRLAQNFSLRYMLVDGQGNFGSVDGDSPAAMRYTECRLSTISEELLRDIDKETVPWADNFDGSLQEPIFLPATLPNLLLNGVSGIAVGMATQIPPHNLGEIIDAINHLIDNPEATVENLMEYVKGPDFPTGGSIFDINEITAAYATGKGRIVMRTKAEIEEAANGRFSIIVTELPYQVNKAVLVARIAELVKDKKIDGISDLRDESDRRGMRMVVELKRDARPKSVLNNLFKHTAMQSVFNANIVALVDGIPRLLSLKVILEEYIKHRREIITKRSEFELKEARARAHILEGLKIAVDNIDEVIEIIKKSASVENAKNKLMLRFKLSDLQAQAILDMQLKRLAALERQKIEDELRMVNELITYLEDLLKTPGKILTVIKNELTKIKEKYGDERKTRIYKQKVGDFSEEDLIPNEPTIITITQSGYVKRQSTSAFRMQHRGGKGVTGITTKEEDTVTHLLSCNTHDNILFFTNKGRVFQLKAFDLPEGSRQAKGQAIINLINIDQGEAISSILPVCKDNKSKFAFMATQKGTVKKTPLVAYENIRRNGLISIKLEKDDYLCWVRLTSGENSIILVSKNGQSICFKESDVRPTGRDTIGVRGINIKNDDVVVGMEVCDPETDLLIVTENGMGKKTKMKGWPIQKRGGQGVKAAQISTRTGKIVAARAITEQDENLVLSSIKGQTIKLDLKSIPRLQRQTQGVILMRFAKNADTIAAAACLSKGEPEIDEENKSETKTKAATKKVKAKTAKTKASTKPKAKPAPHKPIVKTE